ncbi:MAG: ABC transporter substrate-binding protein [Gammaproteobacteria bacterium]
MSVWSIRLLLACALTGMASMSCEAEDPIKIGLIGEITGTQAEAGVYTVNGAKLALEEINKAGGVLGRSIDLKIEDNQSTNPGTVLAFSKLIGEGGLAGIIGPIRSTQIQAASPTIKNGGIPTMIGGTDPSLTHVNNPWVFRARPNDTFSSKVIADFGINTLKLKKWAIVHSTDAFGTGGKNALSAELKALGAEPVLVQGYTNNSQDFTPIVLAIKQSGADVMGTYMTNTADQAIFAKQMRQLGVTPAWVGSPTTIAVTTRNLAGESLYGSYAVADFTWDANELTQSFTKKYREKYNVDPDNFASWAYDALYILVNAIKAANGTDPEAIRKQILAIRDYKGLEGTYHFDENGDGLRGYNIVKNDNGKIVFIKHIEFPIK